MPDAQTSRPPADRAAPAAHKTLAEQLSFELSDIRRRGLDDLDLDTHKKDPRSVPLMKGLAAAYCQARGLGDAHWVAQIRTLLRDGLDAFAQHGNEQDSQFIASLFFDTSGAVPPRGPADLLQAARETAGLTGKENEARFAEKRRTIFLRFTTFLITFVSAATRSAATHSPAAPEEATTAAPLPPPVAEEPPPPVAEEPPPAQPTAHRRLSRERVAIAAVSLIAVLGVLGALLFTGHLGLGSLGARHAPTGTVSPAAHYQPGKTYAETTGEYGTSTFTDPHRPAVQGPRIEAYTKVQVACKVFAPTIPSISPDGYWYRVVSPQQFANLYAPATNFLNGDPVVGARKHYTDFAVPDCPS